MKEVQNFNWAPLAKNETLCDFDKLSDPQDILTKIMLNGFPFIDQTWN